jgi:hypothetical protein
MNAQLAINAPLKNAAPTAAAVATVHDQRIVEAYREAEKSREALRAAARRIAISGFLLAEKRRSLDHGQWLPWCKTNAIDDRNARYHMDAARACAAQLQIGNDFRFEGLPVGLILTSEPEQLPAPARQLQDSFFNITHGRSAKQLVLEWKSDEPHKPEHPNKCEHCQKPVAPQACVCPHCKKEITPKLTAADISAAKKAKANEIFNLHMGRLHLLVTDADFWDQISDIQKELLIAAHVSVNHVARGKLNMKQRAILAEFTQVDSAGAIKISRSDIKTRLKALKPAKKK